MKPKAIHCLIDLVSEIALFFQTVQQSGPCYNPRKAKKRYEPNLNHVIFYT